MSKKKQRKDGKTGNKNKNKTLTRTRNVTKKIDDNDTLTDSTVARRLSPLGHAGSRYQRASLKVLTLFVRSVVDSFAKL